MLWAGGSNKYGVSGTPTVGNIYTVAGQYRDVYFHLGHARYERHDQYSRRHRQRRQQPVYRRTRREQDPQACGINGTLTDFADIAPKYSGDGGGTALTSTTFSGPYDVSWDSTTSSLYVADTGNLRIRCINTTTTAGSCGQSSLANANRIYLVAGGGASNPGNGGWAQSDPRIARGISILAGADLYVTQFTASNDLH